MALDDRLLGNIRSIDKKAARQNLYYAEEPDWMIYDERKAPGSINDYKGITEEKDLKSINTAPSVFEKGTIFHTE